MRVFLLGIFVSVNGAFAHLTPTPPTLSLFQKQIVFSSLSAKLIQQAQALGYDVTLGEAWRSDVTAIPPKEAQWYADHGKGIKNSLHTQRLAIDINLFKDGKFLTKTEDYKVLGLWWEKQSTPSYSLSWGGNFKTLKDGNHFSLQYGGIR